MCVCIYIDTVLAVKEGSLYAWIINHTIIWEYDSQGVVRLLTSKLESPKYPKYGVMFRIFISWYRNLRSSKSVTLTEANQCVDATAKIGIKNTDLEDMAICSCCASSGAPSWCYSLYFTDWIVVPWHHNNN